MHVPPLLTYVLVIFAVSVAVSLLFARWKLPEITGLLVAGVLLGPGVTGLVEDGGRIAVLAEIGVILLLFTVGLELSLDRLRRIWRSVVLGGSLQVGLTAAGTTGLSILFGFEPPTAVLLGFLVAMSSTAIVLRALSQRGETEAPHGRLVVGVLVFQDLCVVPMMLAVPMLAGEGSGPVDALLVAGRAAAVVVGTLLMGRFVVPRVLGRVAAWGSRDILLLAVTLVSLLAVWASAAAGLSLALGAFLAGVVVAGTPFGRQAISDALPFRNVFVSLFFVSVGLLLDVPTVVARPGAVFGLAAAILAAKLALAMAAALVMRLPIRTAALAGVGLAQVGEFSFVLLGVGAAHGLVPDDLGRLFLASAVITMLVTPPLLGLAPRFAAGAERLGPLARIFGARPLEETAEANAHLTGHVIIAGYGAGGRLLGDSLAALDRPYLVLDLNAESVRSAAAAGVPAFYGDVTSAEVLHQAGLHHASAFVLVLSDPGAVLRAVEVARGAAPHVPIVARCRFVGEEPSLRAHGATEVVAAELESSVEVLAHVLRLGGLPRNVIDERIDQARAAAGPVERRMTVPPMNWRQMGDVLHGICVESWLVGPADWAVGKSLSELGLRASTGASVVAVRRAGELRTNPGADERIAAGDVVMVIGEKTEVRAAGDWLALGRLRTADSGPPLPD